MHYLEFVFSERFYPVLTSGIFSVFTTTFAILGAFYLVQRSELRKRRINTIIDMMSYRHQISSNSYEAGGQFFSAINSVPVLFGSNRVVMNSYRGFYSATKERMGDEADRKLLRLLKVCCQAVDLPGATLSEEELGQVLNPGSSQSSACKPKGLA